MAHAAVAREIASHRAAAVRQNEPHRTSCLPDRGADLRSSGDGVRVRGIEQVEQEEGRVTVAKDEEELEELRLTRLALSLPTPVYRKRGLPDARAPRLWFDPTLAVWLVSHVTIARAGEGVDQPKGRWQETQQFLRGLPASPMLVDATAVPKWHVRLVGRNQTSGESEETWVACPELHLTRGVAGKKVNGGPRTAEAPPPPNSPSTDSKPSGSSPDASGRSGSQPRPATSSDPKTEDMDAVHEELARLRKRAENHPAYVQMMAEAQAGLRNDPNVKDALRNLAKERTMSAEERAKRDAFAARASTAAKERQARREEREQAAKAREAEELRAQEAKVQEIFARSVKDEV